MHSLFTNRSRQAFTIVELLVVVGIILILAGLLLSAVTRARESGRSTACLSNLRQIGIAMNFYLQDHRETFFWGSGTGEDQSIERFRWGGRESNNLGGSWFNVPSPRPLNSYLQHDANSAKGLVSCPSDKGRPSASWDITREYGGTSYTFNSIGKQNPTNMVWQGGLTSKRLSAIKEPSRTIVFIDDPLNYLDEFGWHHSQAPNSGNILFVDLHVENKSKVDGPEGNGWSFLP